MSRPVVRRAGRSADAGRSTRSPKPATTARGTDRASRTIAPGGPATRDLAEDEGHEDRHDRAGGPDEDPDGERSRDVHGADQLDVDDVHDLDRGQRRDDEQRDVGEHPGDGHPDDPPAVRRRTPGERDAFLSRRRPRLVDELDLDGRPEQRPGGEQGQDGDDPRGDGRRERRGDAAEDDRDEERREEVRHRERRGQDDDREQEQQDAAASEEAGESEEPPGRPAQHCEERGQRRGPRGHGAGEGLGAGGADGALGAPDGRTPPVSPSSWASAWRTSSISLPYVAKSPARRAASASPKCSFA